MFSTENPSVSPETTKAFTFLSSTSRAKITTSSAFFAPPIQRFSPLRIHESPSRRALVANPPAISDP